jgi:hypothetical protein
MKNEEGNIHDLIQVDWQSKTVKDLNENIQSSGWDLNQLLSGYESWPTQ